jgi:tetratricopeptide (TPR) repeat protein
LLAYGNTFSVPFLFDDEFAITNNATIRDLGNLHAVFNPPTGGVTTHGRPLVNLSLAINHAIHGFALPGYHLFNILVHILNGWLLFAIVQILLTQKHPRMPASGPLPSSFSLLPSPFLVALLWLLHPLCTQAVTYVIQRAEAMAALCYLLTLYALIRSALTATTTPSNRDAPPGGPTSVSAASAPSTSATPRIPTPHRRLPCWSLTAILACAAGMATKETVITAPLAALLLDRAYLASSWREVWTRRRWLHLALLATWGIQLAIQLQPGTAREARTGFGAIVSPWHYLLTESEVLLHYLRLAIWPSPLVFDYQWPIASSLTAVWPAFALLAALFAGALWLWLRAPRAGFPALAFFLILAPTSSIMPIADAAAEHRMYLPLAALIALLACAAARLARTAPTIAAPGVTPFSFRATLLLALLLGIATFARNRDYRTPLTLWNDTIAKRPASARAWYNRGYVFENAGNPNAAVADYRQALAINPNYAGPYYNLGNLDLAAGRFSEAIANYSHAIDRETGNVLPYYNRGIAKIRLGRAAEAMADFDACIRIAPHMANAYLKRGDVHAQFDRYAEAIADYTRAIERDANLADAWHNRAAAHAMLGNLPAARADLIQCRNLGSEPAPELVDMVGGLDPTR